MSVRSTGLVLAVAMAAGAAVAAAPVDGPAPRVVVAVIDSAPVPYHDVFHRVPSQVTAALLDELGVFDTIRLTRTGDYDHDVAADLEQFEAVEEGELYWYEGTNLFGITFAPGEVPLLPDHRDYSHGMAVTSAVLEANPEAIVIAVEGGLFDAEQWAFRAPFVDIVSTSYGFMTSPGPETAHRDASYDGVVTDGRLHVGATPNWPTPSAWDGTSGPWWSLGVAGLNEGEGNSRAFFSSQLPDVVGDFRQWLPYCGNCESGGIEESPGTSFAAPRVAGTISRIVLEARRALGHTGGIVVEGLEQPAMAVGEGRIITNWDVRRAVEEAAWYPTEPGDSEAGEDADHAVPTDRPWLSIGWGLVTPDPSYAVVDQALSHLGLTGAAPSRTKPQEACDFLTAQHRATWLLWNVGTYYSDSFGSLDDPYVPC